jgi:uncharacterized protein VirK/YbjX
LKILEETKGAWSNKSHPELKTDKDINEYVKEKRRSYRKKAEGDSK